MNMNVEGWRGRGRPKKRWIDCVRQDLREMTVSDEMTSDRGENMLCRLKVSWEKMNFYTYTNYLAQIKFVLCYGN
jgi:hypothetical protein